MRLELPPPAEPARVAVLGSHGKRVHRHLVGPKKTNDVVDSAFIQTIPGRNFLIALRLYGSGVEFYDQTWKPDDVVKMK